MRFQGLGDHGLNGQHADGQFDSQHFIDNSRTVSAGGHQDTFCVDFAPRCFHAGDFTALGVNGGGFGLLVDVHTMFGAAFGQTPDHGVMADDAAGGMEHGTVDGKGDIFGDVQRRHQFLGFLGIDEVAFHPMKLGCGDGHPGRFHSGFTVHQVQVAAVVEHQVEIQLLGQHRPQIQRFLIKRNVILGSLIGPDDGRVPAGTAEPDIAFFNDGHIRQPVFFGQEVCRGQPMQSAADDHGVIAGLEPFFLPP
jgi:hypothetical protein